MKRISLDIEDELYQDLRAYVPHGFRRHLLAVIIRLAVDAVKDNGQVMIGALMAGEFKLVKAIRVEAPDV